MLGFVRREGFGGFVFDSSPKPDLVAERKPCGSSVCAASAAAKSLAEGLAAPAGAAGNPRRVQIASVSTVGQKSQVPS